MNRFRIQQKVGILFVGFCLLLVLLNTINFLWHPVPLTSVVVNLGPTSLLACLGLLIVFVDGGFSRVLMVLLFLIPSGPAVLLSGLSFFGMWMFIIALAMIIKFEPFGKYQIVAIVIGILYFLPWMIVVVTDLPGWHGNYLGVAMDFSFLIVAVMTLYFLFEEEIRALLASNSQKDLVLANQAVEIARMEPLSVLGERVAHVTHSFKNNLSHLKSIAVILEETKDPVKGAQMLHEVSASLNERIENILMVSRSGVDLEPEAFDAARVLEGVKFVYLTEPSFAKHVWHETNVSGPVTIYAVRWDFILMVENILKNALQAVQERQVRGIVRVELAAGLLTISNNGGAMELCQNCIGDCLECHLYGKPGLSSRKNGTGHGLAQVFATCRKNRWSLRIRTEGEWTIFQILLAKPAGATV